MELKILILAIHPRTPSYMTSSVIGVKKSAKILDIGIYSTTSMQHHPTSIDLKIKIITSW